jgi:hypothetical protein
MEPVMPSASERLVRGHLMRPLKLTAEILRMPTLFVQMFFFR